MKFNDLITVGFRHGIAVSDGGYSSCLVGYKGQDIDQGESVPWSHSIKASRPGFILEASGAPVLVYHDVVASICPCVIPPSDSCDLRKFNFEDAADNLIALKEYAEYLKQPETDEEQVQPENPVGEPEQTPDPVVNAMQDQADTNDGADTQDEAPNPESDSGSDFLNPEGKVA